MPNDARTGRRPDWTDTWSAFAVTMAKRSRCDRAHIGAVIVGADNRIVATGYNGPPARWNKVHHDSTCNDWCPRMQASERGEPIDPHYADCPANHAEINALMHSSRADRELGVIFVTGSVCMACAKAIANSGLSGVVLVNVDETADAHRHPQEVRKFLGECGLFVVITRV